MVGSKLDHIRERLAQNRDTRDAAGVASDRPSAPADVDPAGIIRAGDRVFDTISGLYGVVLNAPRLQPGAAALLAVRLANGSLVMRPADQLITRPAAPSA